LTEKKIVVIGAGSLAFTPHILSDIVLSEDLKGSTVALVDIDAERLALMTKLADRMVNDKKADIKIESTLNRREPLRDADFVIVTIAVGGPESHDFDGQIPVKYGIYQTVADTVGPGGFSRALRHVPVMVDIARDVEDLCSDAILFNETNPMTCLCDAVRRVTKVNIIGLCHGVLITKAFLARYIEEKTEEAWAVAAGINHLTWILDFRIRGDNAYGLVRRKWERSHDPKGFPISFKLFDIYGIFPSPGDTHVAEFYPYFLGKEPGGGQKYGLKQYPKGTIYAPEWREEVWQRVKRWSEPESSLEELWKRAAPGERSLVTDMMISLTRKETRIFEAVNIPNQGFVTNLPKDAIVEVPAVMGPSGTRGIHVGDVPKGVAATLQHRIMQQELTVDAALTGDRNLALQALLADPMIPSIEVAENLLDDLLKAHADYLPQFKTK